MYYSETEISLTIPISGCVYCGFLFVLCFSKQGILLISSGKLFFFFFFSWSGDDDGSLTPFASYPVRLSIQSVRIYGTPVIFRIMWELQEFKYKGVTVWSLQFHQGDKIYTRGECPQKDRTTLEIPNLWHFVTYEHGNRRKNYAPYHYLNYRWNRVTEAPPGKLFFFFLLTYVRSFF